MAWEYLSVGTQRLGANNTYIGNTGSNYATKLYHVHVLAASTSATALFVAASGTGSQLTTVSGMGTIYVAVSPEISSTTYCWGAWDCSYGILITAPVLFITSTGITCAVVSYQQVPR